MRARSVNHAVFETAAEIVSPGTAVTIRDDLLWGADSEARIRASGPPAAVLTFVFGLGCLDGPGQRAVANHLIGSIAYRTDGMEIIAAFPGWQFQSAEAR